MTFKAIYKEKRSSINQTCDMVLLCNIVNIETNEEFRDHCWIKSSNRLSKLNLKLNDNIIFDATIYSYKSTSGLSFSLNSIKNIRIENEKIPNSKK